MKLFSFLKKQTAAFDKKGFLTAVFVFADKVVVCLIKKERSSNNDTFILVESITEPQEESFLGGDFDFNKLKLSLGKIKAVFLKKNNKSKNVIFAFSPEVATSVLVSKKFERVDEGLKISQEEIDKMRASIKAEFLKGGRMISLEKIEKVLVDGYLMDGLIGLSGKEVNIGLLGVSSKYDLNKKFKELASFLKRDLKGVMAIDISVFNLKKDLSKTEDALFINILLR